MSRIGPLSVYWNQQHIPKPASPEQSRKAGAALGAGLVQTFTVAAATGSILYTALSFALTIVGSLYVYFVPNDPADDTLDALALKAMEQTDAVQGIPKDIVDAAERARTQRDPLNQGL